ncbi:3'-5' exoribonuclease YhaM family protein [Bombilactobacillus bombi]|uniref:3'-5' exoribonuclease YhaM family protein n=1 Tax=Bombilactobacillus bombi TaxID=1303590 RepID=UPI0015E62AF5|nr:HD domain-containing protein [Bombilactobacillus bombi]MBA1434584.1 HD domain-containing protein [Bombilactobacillus bombi]
MNKKLVDLHAGMDFELPVLIKQVDVRTARNGKQFLALNFADDTAELPGKFWDASPQDIQDFTAGQVVLLNGKCELYNGALQIKIISMKIAEAHTYSQNQFIRRAPLTKQQLQDQLNELLFQITQPQWNRIVRYLLKQHQEAFFEYPAAKSNHHDYLGGLAFHTLSMAKLAQNVCQQYPQVNRSLLLAGTLLHDLGKTSELSGPLNTQYTLAGNLLGHIVLIDGEIVTACQKLNINPETESVLLLRHMVIAHHGLNEYGSPKRPQLLEAEILHQLDELDASITMISKAQKRTGAGQYTERIFGLDNRRFLVPNFKDKKE